MGYYEIMRGIENIFNLRLSMVKCAIECDISEAARRYKTTRPTVRKWVTRYKKEGLKGLVGRKRTPKHIPHKTPKEVEERIIELRKTHPAWGPERLIMHYDITPSSKTIGRIIREAGLVRKKKKRWKKSRDLREMKKRFKVGEFIMVDVKDNSDIEKYWPQMKALNLPRYEYTARDVRSGGTWFAYGRTDDTTNSAIFALYLIEHIKLCGVEIKDTTIQTDNGSEFIGCVTRRRGKSLFEGVLERFGINYSRIPPGAKTWQSDVEAFHRIVEDEFYDIEDYKDMEEFKAKAYAYQLYFNFERKNRYKWRKSPIEILDESGAGDKISNGIFNLPPIILDDYADSFIESRIEGGVYHVPTSHYWF